MVHESNDSDTLKRILHEATPLFVAGGYEGVSMREIAAAVGITKAALYYHFRDKEELFMAILNASLEEIGGVLDRAEAAGPGARGRIGEAMQGLLELPAERRALIRVASQEMVHVSPDVRAAFNVVYQQVFVGRLASMLEAGMRDGEVKPIDPQLATWLLLGMAYPFFHPAYGTESMTEVAATLTSVFFEGLGTA